MTRTPMWALPMSERPLRSVMIGDCDHYLSPYILGVAAACGQLGVWHTQVSIRQPAAVIRQRLDELQPDLVWTHMLLWAPTGSCPRDELLSMCEAQRKRGAFVLLHDGDAKEKMRYPSSVAHAVSLALVNHAYDRSVWGVPTMWWPYAAMPQFALARSTASEFTCELAFAGQVVENAIYSARGRLIEALRRSPIDFRVFDSTRGLNTLWRTAELAACAGAVLGFGRKDVRGWVDTRVTQYTGAGAILVHDDVAGLFEPWVHFVPYETGSADSVVAALQRLKGEGATFGFAMRERAFEHAQAHHSWTARVHQVLERAFGRKE